MLNIERLRKQVELEHWLKKLADRELDTEKEEEIIKGYIQELENIYSGGFRHSYSSFFGVILDLNEEGGVPEYLAVNLFTIQRVLEENQEIVKDFQLISSNLNKLSDHLNLEIAQFNYIRKFEDKIKDDARSTRDEALKTRNEALRVQKDNDEIRVKNEIIIDKFDRANEKLSSYQSELISVLGLFAAIVVGGVGSFSGLSNIFTDLQNTDISKLILAVSFTGLVIFNTVFMMLYVISKMTGRNIYNNCIRQEESVGCRKCPNKDNCWTINIIKNRLPYVYWFNLICILTIVITSVVEYLVMKYHYADWLLILFAMIFVGLSIHYGIKNSLSKVQK